MIVLNRAVVLFYWSFAIISCGEAVHVRPQIVHERFQAVETAALLSPRYYPPAPAQPLQKRQNVCAANQHSCIELGDIGSDFCCLNTQYCIVNQGKAGCCQIGSTCGSKCSESQFECDSTTTITSAGTTTTSLVPACCGRRCPQTSMFGCPSSLGNGCCSYDSTCAPGKNCVSRIQESTTEPAVVTGFPEGCTTSQISCDATLGGGCCAVTQSCVRVENGVRCAEITVTPTGSGISAVPADNELSAGAKAGISVGVIVVAGLVIGGVTYMCLRRRRRRVSEAASSSANPRPRNVVGALIGGTAGAGRTMTDLNSDSVSRPGGGLPGVAQDYFGPDAQIGPYSDAHPDHFSPGTTPGVTDRGVPVMPHGPGDIAAPVEIDSRPPQPSPQPASMVLASPDSEETRSNNNNNNNISNNVPRFQPPSSHVAVEGTFELYGSDPDPPASNLTPHVPSPSIPESGVSPSGETIPSPSPGFDGSPGRR